MDGEGRGSEVRGAGRRGEDEREQKKIGVTESREREENEGEMDERTGDGVENKRGNIEEVERKGTRRVRGRRG